MECGGLRISNQCVKYPLVSIICVTRNAEKTLPALINSVAGQNATFAELIIIDGASEDGTCNILKTYDHKIDFWLSEPDNGIYHAMNKSLSWVRGRWVLFLGADDLLAGNFFKIAPYLKKKNTIYYGNAIYFGREFTKVYTDYYLTKLNICHQAIFYPKTVFDKYKYDLQYKVYADYHLNLRCWKDVQFNFVHIDHLVANFGDCGFSTYTKDTLFELDRDQLFKKYLKPSSYYRYLNRTIGFWATLKRLLRNN